MTKYRVEFNKSGFISGAGIWETLDEICEVTAASAQDAIDDVMNALISEDNDDVWRSYAWRACECSDEDSNWTYVKYDEVIDYDE